MTVRFSAFNGIRYAVDTPLDKVTAPPYDVLTGADVAALAARHPHNIVRIDDPAQLPHDGDPYAAAGALLRQWLRDGVLVRDVVPSLTIHRMHFTDATGAVRDTCAVLGALEVVDEGAGGVLPHERTTPKAASDRLDLTRATRANLSPVWGLSLGTGLTDALAAPGEHLGSVVVNGVEHTVERVTDPERVATITSVIAADDVLIADGHHRYSIARKYRDEMRADGVTDSPAESTLAYVGELVPEQISVAPIHRVYSDTGFDELRPLLAGSFELSSAPEVTGTTIAELVSRGALLLVGPSGNEWLTPHPGAFTGVRDLDGAWLESALPEIPVTFDHDVDACVAAVRSGRASAAVLIRPVSPAEILRTGREGLLMPPKSTFFVPKPLTGFVIRDLGQESSTDR